MGAILGLMARTQAPPFQLIYTFFTIFNMSIFNKLLSWKKAQAKEVEKANGKILPMPVIDQSSHIKEMLEEAVSLHQSGNLNQAQEIYDAILKIQPSHADSLHYLGIVNIQTGNYQRAVEYIEKAIAENPTNPGFYINHGNALKALMQLDAAVASYDKAIAIKPDFADAYYNRGVALHELKKLAQAIDSYDKAIAINPEFSAAATNRDIAHQEQQNTNMGVALNEISTEFQSYPLFLHVIVVLGAKRTMLAIAKNDIRTLVVGSSHGDYGFNPEYCAKSFNLCHRSQDLKHSYLLYKKSIEICPNIKNSVVFYSIFSSGSFIEKSPSTSEISPAVNEIFTLGIKYTDKKLTKLADGIKGKLDNLSVGLEGSSGFLPTINIEFGRESYGVQKRAAEFLRRNKEHGANAYLLEIIALAKTLGHKLYVVIPPVRSDLKVATGGSGDVLFHGLFEIISKCKNESDITLFNFYDSNLFLDEYFGDFDHLVPLGNGTKLLSSMINDAINSNTGS